MHRVDSLFDYTGTGQPWYNRTRHHALMPGVYMCYCIAPDLSQREACTDAAAAAEMA